MEARSCCARRRGSGSRNHCVKRGRIIGRDGVLGPWMGRKRVDFTPAIRNDRPVMTFPAISLCLGVLAVFPPLFAQNTGDPSEATLPPAVEVLDLRYATAMSELDQPLADLRQSYFRKVEELKTERQAQGDLAGVLVLQDELKLAESTGPGSGSRYQPLADLQKIYHEHAVKTADRIKPQRLRVEETYQTGLAAIVAALTREGNIDEALLCQQHLEASKLRMKQWQSPSTFGSANVATATGSFSWLNLQKGIEEGRLARTPSVGGAAGDVDLEIPKESGLLVGFEISLGPFGKSQNTVRKIAPLYRTASGKVIEGKARANAATDEKKREIAKDRYVVAGITTHSEAGIRKMKVRYEAIRGMGTNPGDSYESEWYGEWEGGRVATLSTEGRLPIGIEGAIGIGVGETKLVVLDVK